MKNKFLSIVLLLICFKIFGLDENAALLDVAINDYKKGQYTFAINNITKYLQITNSEQNKAKAMYYLSLSYYFTDNYKMSLKNFNELIKKYRTSSYSSIALFWIGLIYQNTGNWSEAAQSFQRYITLYSHSELVDKAYFAYSNCLIELGKIDQAEENLKILVTRHQKSDKYEAGSVLYAYILMQSGKTEEAKQFLQSWAIKLGDTGDNYIYKDRFWLYLAEILIGQDNLIEAKTFLKKIDLYCDDNSSKDIALLRLAYIENKLGQSKLAKQYIDRLSAEFPESKYNADGTLFLAMMSFEAEEYEDCKSYLNVVLDNIDQRLVKTTTTDDEVNRLTKLRDQAIYYMAGSEQRLNNYQACLPLYIQLSDDESSLFATSSILQTVSLYTSVPELNVTPEQIYDYILSKESLATSDPKTCDTFLLAKARLEFATDRYENAVKTVEQINDDKLLVSSSWIKSNALIKLNRKKQARQYLQECFNKVSNEDKTDFAFDIMNLYFNEGDYHQALKYYNIILTYSKNSTKKDITDLFVRTGYLCGLTYLQIKDNKRGIEILQNVLSRAKTLNISKSSKKLLENAYYYLGWLYYRDSDFVNAAKNFGISSGLDIDSSLKRDSYYMQAWSYFSGKDYATAADKFQAMSELYSGTEVGYSALFRCAKCYENLKNEQRATNIYKTLANSNNKYKSQSLYELAKIELSKHNFVAATSILTTLQKLDSDLYAQALLLQAQKYVELKRYSEAYSNYNYYLRNYKSDNKNSLDNIIYWAGFCAVQVGDDLSATELLTSITPSSSFYAESLALLAEISSRAENLTKEKDYITELLPRLDSQADVAKYKQRLTEISLMEQGLKQQEAGLLLNAAKGGLEEKFVLASFYMKSSSKENVEKGLALMKNIAEIDKNTIGARANVAVADLSFDANEFDKAVKIYFKTATSYTADKSIISQALYKTAYCYYRLGKMKLFNSIVDKLQKEFPDEEWTAKAVDLQKRIGS